MDDYKDFKDFYDNRVQATLKKLERNGFTAFFESDSERAVKTILSNVTPGATVGIGGSLTVRQLGVIEQIQQRGHEVFDHWEKGLDAEEIEKAKLNQLTSDIFITGINAVTMDGKLVNIDGAGNRVASMIYGSKKVIAVAGYNKIVTDLQAGLDRIKNTAAPKNALRLNKTTPCTRTGRCMDCKVPERICRITTIIEAKPMQMEDFIVVIVGEELGL